MNMIKVTRLTPVESENCSECLLRKAIMSVTRVYTSQANDAPTYLCAICADKFSEEMEHIVYVLDAGTDMKEGK